MFVLLKTSHGLIQAARHHFDFFSKTLVDIGFQQSPADPCLFLFKNALGMMLAIVSQKSFCSIQTRNDQRAAMPQRRETLNKKRQQRKELNSKEAKRNMDDMTDDKNPKKRKAMATKTSRKKMKPSTENSEPAKAEELFGAAKPSTENSEPAKAETTKAEEFLHIWF